MANWWLVGAICTGVPTDGNIGGWKNGGGIRLNLEPVNAAPSAIGWKPMPAAREAAALLAAAADDSGWEQHGPVYLGV